MSNKKQKHILIKKATEIKDYHPHRGGGKKFEPGKDRKKHGEFLKKSLDRIITLPVKNKKNTLYLEFKVDSENIYLESFEDLSSNKVRLLNFKKSEKDDTQNIGYATVCIHKDKKDFYTNKLNDYIEKDTPQGKPKNYRFIESIEDICEGDVESFWTDKNDMPNIDKEWCEVWLRVDAESINDIKEKFISLTKELKIQVKEGEIEFPERLVKLVYANYNDLKEIIDRSDDIAEFRHSENVYSFFHDLKQEENVQWYENLLSRTQISPDDSIAICVMDTGVNNNHTLIKNSLSSNDCLTYDKTWGTYDHNGHGTKMAGVTLYGDLAQCLNSDSEVLLSHRLESIKIMPKSEDNPKELWGDITANCVSNIEINSPKRKRAFCYAITGEKESMYKGYPTSWSAAIDQICSGAMENEDIRRLMIISAGNVCDDECRLYPDYQKLSIVQSPAQSWNALTVGAYTQLNDITSDTYKGFRAIAPVDGLSPYSSTSRLFEKKCPIKPDILMEGGNLATDGSTTDQADDLSLISTSKNLTTCLFDSFNMTSAATAKACWFAGQLMRRYPEYEPETIRALIVHSAEWTEKMKEQFLGVNRNKSDYENLLRTCGYGVPSLDRAKYSGDNSLTLISQSVISPYKKKGSNVIMNEMHLYKLPWPKEVLSNMSYQDKVSMRVTLSYFIEPGPGRIGWENRYKYPSCNLRFEVKTPSESYEDFSKRINSELEKGESKGSSSNYWLLGTQQRNKGSIISDYYNATPQDLAEVNVIAVYPTSGWWKERKYLQKYNKKIHYSLIVSLQTQTEDIDIYTPVLNEVKTIIEI